MLFTVQHRTNPHWDTLVRQKRRKLRETKAEFGRRFGVTGQAVLYWETGRNSPPNVVTWWLYLDAIKVGKK